MLAKNPTDQNQTNKQKTHPRDLLLDQIPANQFILSVPWFPYVFSEGDSEDN